MEGAGEVRDRDSTSCHHTECLLGTRHRSGQTMDVISFHLFNSSGR